MNLGIRTWESGPGNLGMRTLESEHGNVNLGARTWESGPGNENLGIRTWESGPGNENLGIKAQESGPEPGIEASNDGCYVYYFGVTKLVCIGEAPMIQYPPFHTRSGSPTSALRDSSEPSQKLCVMQIPTTLWPLTMPPPSVLPSTVVPPWSPPSHQTWRDVV